MPAASARLACVRVDAHASKHSLTLCASVQAVTEPKTLAASILLGSLQLVLSLALRTPLLYVQPAGAKAPHSSTLDAVLSMLWAASGGLLDNLLWRSWQAALTPLRALAMAVRVVRGLAWRLACQASALALLAATESLILSFTITVGTFEACTTPLNICGTLLLDAAFAGRKEQREAELRASRELSERLRPIVEQDFRNGELTQARQWALHEGGTDWYGEDELLNAWRRRHEGSVGACAGIWGRLV